ncbi:Detected protein of confused Function [Hibiscus syriacus]|uniref:Detected protein of confused Function n=1 Tax=Hibiscus syriacus TaxID=106335 RepID=A0A6A2WM40_HIBSY|nr:alpha-1,3-arabinosyltransferase XAT3-like [Hibiscus syriacus]KAE8661202.1 Detected protein of confused Function [Hibiscus syriacus]
MVHHQRYNYSQLKKGGDDEEEGTLVLVWTNPGYYKRRRTKLFSFLLLSLLSCTFILAPHFFTFSSPFSHLYSFGVQNESLAGNNHVNAPICSSISNGTICCDRSHFRSDVCFMKGDIRTQSPTSSVYVYSSRNGDDELQHEKIKPYTRKWETSVMDTIDELDLISKRRNSGVRHRCDVVHDVPAVMFSTGGYTGNVYHEFNDGIIPLYITSQQFNKKVVFVILEYHNWWVMKYGDILSHLSNYPPIDFNRDNRTHCFTEAITGLRIHDELTVDPLLMKENKSIVDFRHLLDRAYRPRIQGLVRGVEQAQEKMQPKLVILSRNGSRAITNENVLVKTAEEVGFRVQVLRPQPTTELAKIYMELNSSDAMIGVHGAAMTHLLFMKPGCSVFIQVIPLGTDWAAETYYGEPAKKMGLRYIGYKINPKESSLSDEYDEDDPVLKNPSSLNQKGWEYTKKIYLERQTVKLDMQRFRKRLVRAYDHIISTNHRKTRLRSQ